MKLFLFLFLLLPLSLGFGNTFHWSKNHVLKLDAILLRDYKHVRDYENIVIDKGVLQATHYTNAWILSDPVLLEEQYQLESVFVHFDKTSPSSYVLVKLRNTLDDSVIASKVLPKTGDMKLVNIFNKNVTVSLDIVGEDIRVYSFGLTRRLKEVINTDKVIILPETLFYTEDVLQIEFTLKLPAILDIIVFDKNGKIIDYKVKKTSFNEGYNRLVWMPPMGTTDTLVSGDYIIYFYIEPMGLSPVEIVRHFTFVNK